ncbi:hypothetical protein Tco_1378436 [Tanacetum coccineum]
MGSFSYSCVASIAITKRTFSAFLPFPSLSSAKFCPTNNVWCKTFALQSLRGLKLLLSATSVGSDRGLSSPTILGVSSFLSLLIFMIKVESTSCNLATIALMPMISQDLGNIPFTADIHSIYNT